MKIRVEIDSSEIRGAIRQRLLGRIPSEMTEFFGRADVEVKMTYRSNATWRRPKYLRMVIEKEIEL
jgi:hypothetical protein